MLEDARDIPGLAGYRIDTEGRCWSCRITKSGLLGDRWHRLKPQLQRAAPGTSSSPRYSLRLDGQYVSRSAYRLVLEAFVGPCPPGMVVCYADGDRSNCRLGNLRWDRESPDRLRGSRRSQSKLKEADIPLIFRMRRERPPVSIRKIANHFGVSSSAIDQVLRGRTWKHIPR